jgi:putative nucleotidyltransferase with HDIG domain
MVTAPIKVKYVPVMKRRFFKNIHDLPTLPTVLSKIISTLDDPRSSAGDLDQIIRHDQSLTTKLLAVANSAYYGFRHEVTTVSRAVVAIGYTEVRNLCLGMGLMGFLDPATFKDTPRAESLWLHSLAVSEGSRIISKWTGVAESEMAFTAGLLHDIGKVVLAAFYPEEIDELKRLMKKKDLSFPEAESEMGISHAEVGKEVAVYWELPPILVEVIGGHHRLHRGLTYLPMVAAVHGADHIACRLDMGDPLHPETTDVSKLAYKALSFTDQTMMQCLEDVKEQREKIVTLWQQLIGADET